MSLLNVFIGIRHSRHLMTLNYMWLFLSLRCDWEIHFIITGPTMEPQAPVLVYRSLGEVDSELHLVLTYWPWGWGLIWLIVGPLLVHFLSVGFLLTYWGLALGSRWSGEVDWPLHWVSDLLTMGRRFQGLTLDSPFHHQHFVNKVFSESTFNFVLCSFLSTQCLC